MRLKIGRVQRQMLAVCALSLALVAVVLVLGGFAVSRLGSSPPAFQYAGSGPAGVYRVTTPSPAAPFAAVPTRAHQNHVTAPEATTLPVAFRPLTTTTSSATAVRTPVRATAAAKQPSAKQRRKPAKKQRTRRRPARKVAPKPASQPAAVIASVTPAPVVKRPNPHSLTRGNSGKPKTTGPQAQPPGLNRNHAAKPQPKLQQAPPAPAPVAAPPAHGNHGRGNGAIGHGPPAHANNGNGNGHAGPPPGQITPKAHGKGH